MITFIPCQDIPKKFLLPACRNSGKPKRPQFFSLLITSSSLEQLPNVSQSGEPRYCFYLCHVHISLVSASNPQRRREWGPRYPWAPSTWYTVLPKVVHSHDLQCPIQVVCNDKRTPHSYVKVGNSFTSLWAWMSLSVRCRWEQYLLHQVVIKISGVHFCHTFGTGLGTYKSVT